MKPRPHLGDSHNFGRRVTARDDRVIKPRTVAWERLVLSGESPLRRLLDEAAEQDGLGRDAFAFLPRLAFHTSPAELGGEVERVALSPLPDLDGAGRRALAEIVGRLLALFAWLGISDLHWENLAIGLDAAGKVIFTPLDIEMIFDDLGRPTETKLIPDADPEYAAISRHAAGVRRALPWLGKPIAAGDLVAMAAAYLATLGLLDRHAGEIAAALGRLPELSEAPIRVCLRGTDEYVRAREKAPWPPLLAAEKEQLARGDIPYFFRLYRRPGIFYFTEPTLRERGRLPMRGDVPQLAPLLSIEGGLRSPSRARLREEGLFTVLGAFDHRSFTGRHEAGDLAVTFAARALIVSLPDGEELEVSRDLGAFVGRVYLPCSCGEVRSVFVPPVTTCESASRSVSRSASRSASRVRAPRGRGSAPRS